MPANHRVRRLALDSVQRLGWRATAGKTGLRGHLGSVASMYLDALNDFSYDFARNGELLVLRRLRALEPRLVFDVGANVGEWTRLACEELPSATIHAFELTASTYGVLASSVAAEPRVVPHDFGLGARDGEVEYNDYGSGSGLNTTITSCALHETSPFVLSQGRLLRGDTFLNEHGMEGPDFLKIDVEGAESQVLQGFSSALQRRAIRVIQFEYGYANGDAKFLMKDFYSFFESRGYTLGKIMRDGVHFMAFDYALNNFKSGPNFLALREDDAEARRVLSAPIGRASKP